MNIGGHSTNVDVALMWIVDMRRPRGEAGRKLLLYCENLVAGAGFEPAAFRL